MPSFPVCRLSPRSLVALALMFAGTACTGSIDGRAESDPAAGPGPSSLPASPPAPGGGGGGGGTAAKPGGGGTPTMPTPPDAPGPLVQTTRLARLSSRQWENAVRDLLRLPDRPGMASRFRGDPVIAKFDNYGASLGVDDALRKDYQTAAEALAEKVAGDAAALARLLPPAGAEAKARARSFVETFGRRAYRRPLTTAEINRYTALFDKGAAAYKGSDPFVDGVRISIEAFLQSANFLYRTELGTATGGDRQALGPYERAAKLSFTLVQSIPDDDLLAAAAAGTLGTAEGVRAQAERLIATPAAQEMLSDFHSQVLRLQTYELIEKDQKTFPDYSAGLGNDMRTETLMFVKDVIDSGGGLRELLLSPRTFVNAKLASIYGVPAPQGAGFSKVDLPADKRAGLLTQAGFLASNAYAKDIDSIHRGVFVHLNILCTNLPPPAPNVSLNGAKGTTNRERVTSVTGDGTCGAGCHSRTINPIGFAFETYDALGHYRTTDSGKPADASGTYAFDGADKTWTTTTEFVQLLAESRAAHACFARNLLEYLHGRPLETADTGRIDTLTSRSAVDKASVRKLVLAVVTNPDFLSRLP